MDLTLHGGLDAVTIEHLSLELRRGDGFTTHLHDKELWVLMLAQVFNNLKCQDHRGAGVASFAFERISALRRSLIASGESGALSTSFRYSSTASLHIP